MKLLVSLALLGAIGATATVPANAKNFDGSATSTLWSKQQRLETQQTVVQRQQARFEPRPTPQYSSEFLKRYALQQGVQRQSLRAAALGNNKASSTAKKAVTTSKVQTKKVPDKKTSK